MNECSSLPPHVLRANPHVQTFDKAFIRARRRPSPTVAVVRGGSGGGGVAMPGYAS